jgi:hypothetical protein
MRVAAATLDPMSAAAYENITGTRIAAAAKLRQ